MGIEDRLENWSRVVRDPSWQPQYCASWARLAVAMRDAECGAPQAIVSIDVNDGWLVEQAWQKIADPVAKRLELDEERKCGVTGRWVQSVRAAPAQVRVFQ